MSNRDNGIIVHWSENGFGFVRPDGAERDLFFHVSAVDKGEPCIGDRISFETGEDRNRRPCALQVRFEAEEPATFAVCKTCSIQGHRRKACQQCLLWLAVFHRGSRLGRQICLSRRQSNA
jgi:cold shock CspA family protein